MDEIKQMKEEQMEAMTAQVMRACFADLDFATEVSTSVSIQVEKRLPLDAESGPVAVRVIAARLGCMQDVIAALRHSLDLLLASHGVAPLPTSLTPEYVLTLEDDLRAAIIARREKKEKKEKPN